MAGELDPGLRPFVWGTDCWRPREEELVDAAVAEIAEAVRSLEPGERLEVSRQEPPAPLFVVTKRNDPPAERSG